MTTAADLLAEEAAMSIHLLAGTYLAQGLSMEQPLAVLHKAVDLVPSLEEDMMIARKNSSHWRLLRQRSGANQVRVVVSN